MPRGCVAECQPYTPTNVDWVRGNPYTYQRITAEDVERLSRGPYLFARKFSRASDIAAVWEDLLERRRIDMRGTLW